MLRRAHLLQLHILRIDTMYIGPWQEMRLAQKLARGASSGIDDGESSRKRRPPPIVVVDSAAELPSWESFDRQRPIGFMPPLSDRCQHLQTPPSTTRSACSQVTATVSEWSQSWRSDFSMRSDPHPRPSGNDKNWNRQSFRRRRHRRRRREWGDGVPDLLPRGSLPGAAGGMQCPAHNVVGSVSRDHAGSCSVSGGQFSQKIFSRSDGPWDRSAQGRAMRSFRSDLSSLGRWGVGEEGDTDGSELYSSGRKEGHRRRRRDREKVDRVKRMRELYFGTGGGAHNEMKCQSHVNDQECCVKKDIAKESLQKGPSWVKNPDIALDYHSSGDEDLDVTVQRRLRSLLSWTEPGERPRSQRGREGERSCLSPRTREDMSRGTNPASPDSSLRPHSRPKSQSSAGTSLRIDSLLEWVDNLEVNDAE
uniref:Uncharacterized protein n=1 Tax=Pseudictyota dubia TaxID=2749911 RepID=A0A7R9WJI7_9STRA|mmetsp:Transcript_6304/g.10859  ORF Transcript_6304/g.10859 Transcript_6304/m.10859 type:complete len:420 (+) Transcript_6304:228-1487(+)